MQGEAPEGFIDLLVAIDFPPRSLLAFLSSLADMPARLHPLMQHAHDLDEARRDGAVENHMHRITDRRLAAFGPAVADVEAADARPKVLAGDGR